MKPKNISMVQECVDSYHVNEKADGGVEIVMRIPKRFRELWLVRLSQMRTNEDELRQYEIES